jgi:pimeloyl-ACP methyl ester carboxylesterase
MTTGKAEENFVSVNKLRLHYLDWGPVGKPPLVCLHGHGGQAHIWDEFAQAMLPYYHVYALDQRGHGESEWASDGYERDLFVEDLATFVDALALLRVTLVGLSMGGWNAMLYAPNHQDRVERIILVDIGPEPSQASRQMMSGRPPMPLQFGSFEEAIAWTRQGDPWATETRLRRDLGDRVRQREDGKWVWKADPALFDTRRGDAWSP